MTDSTNAERQARHRAKVRKEMEALRNASNTAPLEARIRELEIELAREKQRAVPKAAKPKRQIDPDSEVASLRKSNRELRAQSRYMREWADDQVAKIKRQVMMPKETFTALVKCLHPDRPQPTDNERAEACGLLTQWKQGQDKKR